MKEYRDIACISKKGTKNKALARGEKRKLRKERTGHTRLSSEKREKKERPEKKRHQSMSRQSERTVPPNNSKWAKSEEGCG